MADSKPTRTHRDVQAHRHAEITEALWRIGIGIEAANRALERIDAALQLLVRSWQAAQPISGRYP